MNLKYVNYISCMLITIVCSVTCLQGEEKISIVTAKQLKEMFKNLPPWPYNGDYEDDEWKEIREAALKVQDANPVVVVNALRQFSLKYDSGKDVSKVFLLLRIVFDLPEKAPRSERFSYFGWEREGRDVVKKDYVNLFWPIGFQNGEYKLQHGMPAAHGPPYRAEEEYKYMLRNFKFRELTELAR